MQEGIRGQQGRGSERAQEVDQVLLVPWRQRVEVPDHAVRLGAVAAMRLDGGDDVAGAAVVQEEDPLSHAPERRAAEFLAIRIALADAVGERADGMDSEIAERLEGLPALAAIP